MLHIKRVLAPVDFSDPSKQALAYAREVAETYRAHLDVLHVIEEPIFPAMYGSVMTELYGDLPDVNQEALEAMQRLLEESGGPDVETGVHVQKGHAAKEILHFVEVQDTDLVVLASQGLTGLEHFVLGSVAEKVVRRAACPVLVVKPEGKSLLPSHED